MIFILFVKVYRVFVLLFIAPLGFRESAVFFIGYRLAPFGLAAFGRNLNGKMCKAAVLRGAVPVLNASRNIYNVSRHERSCLLAPCLIPAAPRRNEQDLSAAAVGR